MNAYLFELLNGMSGYAPSDKFGIFCAEILIFVMAIGVLTWALFNRARNKNLAMMLAVLALGTLIAWVLSEKIKALVGSPRPFVVLGDAANVIISYPSGYAFPSGHTTAAFAMAVGVWWYAKKAGTVFLLMAALVGFGRIFVGVHWPVDVLGGAALGTLVASAAHMVAAWFVKYRKGERNGKSRVSV